MTLDETPVDGETGHLTDHTVVAKKLNVYIDARADFGAAGDGTADDTAELQAAIDAAVADCLPLHIPPRPSGQHYKTTAPLEIDQALTMFGGGIFPLAGSQAATEENINLPTASPYLKGSLIKQATAGANVIEMAGAGVAVNLRDLGLGFVTPFLNTGHGIYYHPPAYNTSYRDNGLWGARWDNVMVHGHDGDHYAFRLTNPILSTFSHLFSFGGGALYVENNGEAASNQFYGNLVVEQLYGCLFLGGTAKGIHLVNTSANSNLYSFIRPQIWVRQVDAAVQPASTTAPGSGQHMFHASGVPSLSIIAPDFETNVSSTCVFPNTAQFIDTGGLINNMAADSYAVMTSTRELPTYKRAIGNTLNLELSAAESGLTWGIADGALEIQTDQSAREVTANGPVSLKSFTTAGRPSAATIGAGASVYDTTLGKPVWSDGTNWKDAAGNTV